MMIFLWEAGKTMLHEAEEWALDGTFDLSPKPFMQLYIVSAVIDKYTLGSAYVYCPNKEADTCAFMMEQIFLLVGKQSILRQIKVRRLFILFQQVGRVPGSRARLPSHFLPEACQC